MSELVVDPDWGGASAMGDVGNRRSIGSAAAASMPRSGVGTRGVTPLSVHLHSLPRLVPVDRRSPSPGLAPSPRLVPVDGYRAPPPHLVAEEGYWVGPSRAEGGTVGRSGTKFLVEPLPRDYSNYQ
ncbi:hypothetical protein HK104_006742 [Borealophlyctis nickersoniae]|nr:hypothetical protein HK104_006742 [Borealophlyctis nickersoniae]